MRAAGRGNSIILQLPVAGYFQAMRSLYTGCGSAASVAAALNLRTSPVPLRAGFLARRAIHGRQIQKGHWIRLNSKRPLRERTCIYAKPFHINVRTLMPHSSMRFNHPLDFPTIAIFVKSDSTQVNCSICRPAAAATAGSMSFCLIQVSIIKDTLQLMCLDALMSVIAGRLCND